MMEYLQNLGCREDAVEVLILHLTTIGIGYASPFLLERSDKTEFFDESGAVVTSFKVWTLLEI